MGKLIDIEGLATFWIKAKEYVNSKTYINTETWTFTLEDGTEITKNVCVN